MVGKNSNITFEQQSFAERSGVRVMNIICIISASLSAISGLVGADSTPYMISLFILSGFFCFTLFLNNIVRHRALTNYFITFGTTAWIIATCILFPATLGHQNYLIIALVGLAIFSKQKLYRNVSMCVLVGAALALDIYHRHYPPIFDAPQAVELLHAVNIVTPLVIIAIMCLIAIKDATMAETVIDLQRRQLEESNQFKDKVFSIIGHDMRSPFNSTLGLLDMLEADLLTPEERAEALGELRQSINTSLQTLDNILGWASQGYYGSIVQAKTKVEPLNAHQLAANTIAFFSQTAAQKNVRFINNTAPDIMMQGDAEQILFVYRNITGNAIKFSHAGQNITLEAKADTKEVTISIKDEGVGMTEDMIARLFKINTRFTREGTTREKGTGLGLIFCKEFVENNKGRIWIESLPGSGTTVYFALPTA